MADERTYLPHDWYAGGVPANVRLDQSVYIDSSYIFAPFLSRRQPGLTMGQGSGVYGLATFVTGEEGEIVVGDYTCLNDTYLICHQRIEIGAHCLLAWGSIITDGMDGGHLPVIVRRRLLETAARSPDRWLPATSPPRPVTLEDNVWVGFDAVILPGVRLGQGSIIGCKTVVAETVPPYAVYAGNPGRVIRYLDADDTPAARLHALQYYARHG